MGFIPKNTFSITKTIAKIVDAYFLLLITEIMKGILANNTIYALSMLQYLINKNSLDKLAISINNPFPILQLLFKQFALIIRMQIIGKSISIISKINISKKDI